MFKRLAFALVATLAALPARAAVTVTGAAGTFSTESTFTVTGAGFGTKSPATPYLWAPFNTSRAADIRGRFDFVSYNTLAWDAAGGFSGGGLVNTDGNGNWTAGTRFPNLNDSGQRAYVYRREKKNFLITSTTQNWKIWRAWVPSSAPTNYPNIYLSASSSLCNVEDGTGTGFTGNFKTNSTSWVEEQIVYEASDFDVKNGSLSYYVGNVLKGNGSIKTRYASRPDYITDVYLCHGVLANKSTWSPAWSTSNTISFDDVYFDTTWSRVMIGNASTLAACTKLQPQIPQTWASGSIMVSGNFSSYTNGDDAWLYVYDSGGLVNASGYHVTVAASAAGPAAPSLTGITPSSGPFQGGTSVTANGTDFSTTVTVNVGTSAATSVVRVSSTRVTFVTPAATPGTLASVTLYNDDLQSSTISSTFTYAAAMTFVGFAPTTGAYAGATSVTGFGTGFTGATPTVLVGTSAATGVSIVSPTRLTFLTPAASTGAVANIRATLADGQSALSTGTFTYGLFPTPTVSSINVSSGLFSGGTANFATGTNFVSPVTVFVGATLATGISLINSTRVDFTVPAGPTGTTQIVTVVIGDGQAAILPNAYTYFTTPVVPGLSFPPWK